MNRSKAKTLAARPSLVLVVDDEPSICWAFERMLAGESYEVLSASSAEEGLRIAADRKPDLILLDVRLPKEDGITALPKFIAATHSPVIIMTAFGDLETAVSAVKNGASEYLIKPFSLDAAQSACRNALLSHAASRKSFKPVRDTASEDQIIGQSAAIQQAFRQIALVSGSDLSVLVTGETGTGKELVAAAIHRHSHRSSHPYLAVAPVTMNPDLIESELFGHIAGSFTGAIADRAGLFEKAEGGTILLDEIGDLPLAIQVKLLRVLEQGEFSRVGEVAARRCDVRIIAATHQDLHQAVLRGEFREDLYYRLNGLQIHLPPLRERVEDLLPLCVHFLQRIEYAQAEFAVGEELLGQLHKRQWFGNVRELKNSIQHAAVVARGRPLLISDFPDPQPGRVERSVDSVSTWEHEFVRWLGQLEETHDTQLYDAAISLMEPSLFRFVLKRCQGNRAKAADLLGIHRGTLRQKLRKHGIDDAADI